VLLRVIEAAVKGSRLSASASGVCGKCEPFHGRLDHAQQHLALVVGEDARFR